MKIRMKFNKYDAMRFIGHLDMVRFFQKAFRRCELPVAYSQGFNPHQILSFASPLGIGLTSDAEYIDIQLAETINTPISKQLFMQQMNTCLVSGVKILDIHLLEETSKNAMSIVAAADYVVSLREGYEISENWRALFENFIAQEQIITKKKTKKSEREINIQPFIYHTAFTREEFLEKTMNTTCPTIHTISPTCNIYMQLSSGSQDNLKPELVIEAFHQFIGKRVQPFSFQIHRFELYANAGIEEEKHFISLNKFGIAD